METSEPAWRLLFRLTEGIRNYHGCRYPCPGPELQISLAQVRVLSCIFMSPNGRVRCKEIAEELGITPGAVSQTVENLVQRGFLRREPDENDRRAVAISLSEEGLERHRKLSEEFEEIVAGLMCALTPRENQELYSIVEKLLAVLAEKKQKEKQ